MNILLETLISNSKRFLASEQCNLFTGNDRKEALLHRKSCKRMDVDDDILTKQYFLWVHKGREKNRIWRREGTMNKVSPRNSCDEGLDTNNSQKSASASRLLLVTVHSLFDIL
jgi:hypothetical protein